MRIPLVAGVFLAFISLVSAGSPPVLTPHPICEAPFNGSVAAAYDTDFVFRGQNLGQHAVTGTVDIDLPFGGAYLNMGTSYINVTQNAANFDRLASYAFLEGQVGGLDVGAGANWYYFPELSGVLDDTLEAGLAVGTDLGLAYLGFAYFYDFEADGNYLQLSATKVVPLSDCLDFNFGTGIGYGDENYVNNGVANGGEHFYVTSGLTFHVSESAALNAYVAGNWLYGDLQDVLFLQDDEVYGGVSLKVGF